MKHVYKLKSQCFNIYLYIYLLYYIPEIILSVNLISEWLVDTFEKVIIMFKFAANNVCMWLHFKNKQRMQCQFVLIIYSRAVKPLILRVDAQNLAAKTGETTVSCRSRTLFMQVSEAGNSLHSLRESGGKQTLNFLRGSVVFNHSSVIFSVFIYR